VSQKKKSRICIRMHNIYVYERKLIVCSVGNCGEKTVSHIELTRIIESLGMCELAVLHSKVGSASHIELTHREDCFTHRIDT